MAEQLALEKTNQINCSLVTDPTKQISIKYHGNFLGYILWIFGKADWIRVGDTKVYVNHASLVATIEKVMDAIASMRALHTEGNETDLVDFYKKTFEIIQIQSHSKETDQPAVDKALVDLLGKPEIQKAAAVFKAIYAQTVALIIQQMVSGGPVSLESWIQATIENGHSSRARDSQELEEFRKTEYEYQAQRSRIGWKLQREIRTNALRYYQNMASTMQSLQLQEIPELPDLNACLEFHKIFKKDITDCQKTYADAFKKFENENKQADSKVSENFESEVKQLEELLTAKEKVEQKRGQILNLLSRSRNDSSKTFIDNYRLPRMPDLVDVTTCDYVVTSLDESLAKLRIDLSSIK